MSNPAPARILILGCGYVGTAVAEAARVRGWDVTALTRNVEKARTLTAQGLRVVTGDLATPDWHAQVERHQDIVLNCVSSGGGGLEGYRRSYVDGMRSVLTWAAGGVAATFLYTGSTSVYPQGDGEIVTEESPVGEGGSAAAGILLETEAMVRATSCFRRWFVLRLAGIYGPGRHYLLNQLRDGATVFPGTGAHRLNLAHRDDIVSAILACAQAPDQVHNECFNVTDDTAAPKEVVTAWIAQQLGVVAPVFQQDGHELPAGINRVRGRSGPIPDRLISNARLKRVLGWQPKFPDFRDGYRQIFDAETSAPG